MFRALAFRQIASNADILWACHTSLPHERLLNRAVICVLFWHVVRLTQRTNHRCSVIQTDSPPWTQRDCVTTPAVSRNGLRDDTRREEWIAWGLPPGGMDCVTTPAGGNGLRDDTHQEEWIAWWHLPGGTDCMTNTKDVCVCRGYSSERIKELWVVLGVCGERWTWAKPSAKRNQEFLDLLWWRANARNVSFQFLYGDQFTSSTQLLNLNFWGTSKPCSGQLFHHIRDLSALLKAWWIMGESSNVLPSQWFNKRTCGTLMADLSWLYRSRFWFQNLELDIYRSRK